MTGGLWELLIAGTLHFAFVMSSHLQAAQSLCDGTFYLFKWK